jgi:hypothetical protein
MPGIVFHQLSVFESLLDSGCGAAATMIFNSFGIRSPLVTDSQYRFRLANILNFGPVR